MADTCMRRGPVDWKVIEEVHVLFAIVHLCMYKNKQEIILVGEKKIGYFPISTTLAGHKREKKAKRKIALKCLDYNFFYEKRKLEVSW